MIHQLTIEDFSEHRTNSGAKLIKLNRPGKWFVFFSTEHCGFCKQFKPEFSNLANIEKKINYGSCVVNDGSKNTVAMKMKDSKTPINNVPYFLVYVDGVPSARYTGTRTAKDIQIFIKDYLKKIEAKAQKAQALATAKKPKKAPVMENMSISKDYYPEGYKASNNPDMGNFGGSMLSLPREIRPWNEPYRYSGK